MGARKPSAKSPTRSSAARSKAGSGEAAPKRAAARRAAGRPVTAGQLLERLDQGGFPTTLWIDGPCEPLKAAMLAEVRRAWAQAAPDAPPRVFNGGESGPDEILSAWQGASLFTTRDLVIVLEIEEIGRSERKVEALADGLATSTGESCLLLVESAAEKERKALEPLRAACRETWTAEPPERRELAEWGRRRFARAAIAAEDGVLDAVLAASEGDPLVFFNELEKLVVMAAGGRLALEEARRLLQPVVGADLPDYLAAVAAGDAGLAARRLGRLLAAGVSEGTVLFSLANLVGGALGGWARHKGLSEALRRRRPQDLGRALDAIYRAEAAWKSGRADVIAVLEQATRAVAAG